MRWPRQLMSLLIVLALLAGPPMLLLRLVGPPISGWPTVQQLRAWVQHPLTEQTLTVALTIAAWLVWLILAYTVTIRVLARLRATVSWLGRVPLPTPLQATASGMAGAAVFGVSANAITAPAPHPPLPATAANPDDPSHTRDVAGSAFRDAGIVVPGGWLPRDVAEQVTAATALVWLRRRRAYRPHPPRQPGGVDQDLTPLPATAAAVQAALAEHPSPPADTNATLVRPTHAPTPASGVLPASGVGLTGPGALAAGRGLLVTTLLAGQHQPTVSLVITRTALTSLLGPAAESLARRLPGLTIADDVDHAVRLLQPRSGGQGGSTHGGSGRPGHETTTDSQLALVLIVDEKAGAADHRGVAGLDAGTHTVVVLGPWPAGQTWQVDQAGRIRDSRRPGQAGQRLCVLDPVAASDLLTVIAHSDPPAINPASPASPPAPAAATLAQRLPRQPTRREPRPTPGDDTRRLELRVLGEPTLLIDGQPLTVRRTAATQILAFLATHPDGADTRHLIHAIWPGPPPHTLTGRLYTTLSELRSTIRAGYGRNVIDHTDDRYRLNPAHVHVDVWRLHTAIQHAATAVTDTTTAWQAVIDAYPDELATGRTWPWLDPIRETLRRHVIDAYVALADAAPDSQSTLALLQAAIRIDPYNADLHARAANTLTALGDPAAAHQLREAYRRRLTGADLHPEDNLSATAVGVSETAPASR
ncbi:AfsR/SARP family transcriptional regulator [Micromonospora costi]|uniref:AfsR/SARP family transcriptional regulator n=1 Tax=Micromonospora costi TaxID=1530042 RepID=UPI0011C39852|nr:hypothetical protein [Micromonospora costi]